MIAAGITSWARRNAIVLVTLLAIATLGLGIGTAAYAITANRAAIDTAERLRIEGCRQDNKRSQIQYDQLVRSRDQTFTLDISRLLGPGVDLAELRRITAITTAENLKEVPFLDCPTGSSIPAPPPPPIPGGK